jgi:hypothetical protein
VRRAICALLVIVGACASSGAASAAMRLDARTSHESLVVDARGDAQISYTRGGAARRVIVRGSTARWSRRRLRQAPDAVRVRPTVPFALVQFRLPSGVQVALQRFRRTGQFGVVGPFELFLARWRGNPTRLTLTVSRGRLCGTATYHGRAIFGVRHTPAGNPLDRRGRNVYLDALRPTGWYRLLGVLARPRGFALAITPDRRGLRYRARIVGPNEAGDLAPVAAAITPLRPPAHPQPCPFPPGTYLRA